MKKIIALLLVMVLTATLAVGGTVAYLTKDAGVKTNTFQVGGIDVELKEETGVGTNGGGTVSGREDGADYEGLMPGDEIIKKVTVTNNGEDDVYVRVTVTMNNALQINNAIDEVYGDDGAQKVYDEVFNGWGLKHTKDLDGDGVNDAGMRLTITGADMPEHVMHVDSVKTIDEYALFYTGNWFGDQEDIIPFDNYYTAGMGNYEFKYTYYMFLKPEESTVLFEGLNIPAEFNAEQLAMFDGLEIVVDADAIQAANIPGEYGSEAQAKEAFKWLTVERPTEVTDAADLNGMLNAGLSTVITGDIAMSENLNIAADSKANLDLDGNTLSGATLIVGGELNVSGGAIEKTDGAGIENHGTATFNNVDVKAGTTGDYASISYAGSVTTYDDAEFTSYGGGIAATNGAKVIFNSGSVVVDSSSTSGRYNFYTQGAGTEIEINGGDFSFSATKNQKRAYVYAGANTTVIINGGNFGKASTRSGYTAGILGDGEVIIKGGTFGFDPSTWVADGYEAVKNGSTWTVSAK